jgi:hypothetical protein
MGEYIVDDDEHGDEVEERVKEKESMQKRKRKRGSNSGAGSQRVRERASGRLWASRWMICPMPSSNKVLLVGSLQLL